MKQNLKINGTAKKGAFIEWFEPGLSRVRTLTGMKLMNKGKIDI